MGWREQVIERGGPAYLYNAGVGTVTTPIRDHRNAPQIEGT